MKLQFDPSQAYQQDAINAVVDIFDGQPISQGQSEITFQAYYDGLFKGQVHSELGIANNLLLSNEMLLRNVNSVQDRNDLDRSLQFEGRHFSVEMETGTGKTYVYLRTIFELNRRYGFRKFIIVVPSIAVREGTLKNLQITEDHFKALYNNVEFEYYLYQAKDISKLRSFATSNNIQILIINIDAFRKNFVGTEDEIKSNVIYKENDRLSGRQPIEFITATQPIVIIDEPQSVDNTEKAQEAIKALNPLCTLRYSATHRNPYHLVYRLDPIRAFDLRLVKQIVVASVTGANAFNDAYVKLLAVEHTKGIKAKIALHEKGKTGIREKAVWVKQQDDLFTRSNERESYRNGFIIIEISAEPENEYIQFDNGKRLKLGQEMGGLGDDLSRVQIRSTIKRHLEKELQVKGRGLKILSLFFIDRVANYRDYDESGKIIKGKYSRWFEEELKSLLTEDIYKGLLPYPIEKLHDGYFAQDKKGRLKDSSEGRSSQDDEDIFNLIMRNKEQLLSLDEPLRFIFSHSALREGWDNPNVFQICTLNETRSVMKKRQELGRGLRLPVNQNGERVFDENINKLTVIANESYETFARTLQNEYEEDCGVTFGKVPQHAFARLSRLVDGVETPVGRDESEKIWQVLHEKGFLTKEGKISARYDPKAIGFDLGLPAAQADLNSSVLDVIQSYRLERHIKNADDKRTLKLNKQVYLDPEFAELWKKIKLKTLFSVEYSTDELVLSCVKAIRAMDKIDPVQIAYREFLVSIENKGVLGAEIRDQILSVEPRGSLPDILAYLQKETELTRATLVRILIDSGRLGDFLKNPQRYMDAVAGILKRELHRFMIDGIKYERVSDAEYSMLLFEQEELTAYLTQLLEVKHSIFDAIEWESEVERSFAEKLDIRQDIKLFVKLPSWFKVETPIGTYNPDWAIVKHGDKTVYLVRETKSTKDYEKLRNAEADKIRCGRKHFEELGVDFDVVVTANEV